MTELRASESLDESLERCGQQGTFGISGIQNAEISRLAQSDAARSRIEESYLKNRTAFFKSFTYKSMPYTMQGVGHLLGGTAGNALCIAGIAGLGLESVHRVADEIGLCGKPEFSSVKLVGNVLQVMGAGLREWEPMRGLLLTCKIPSWPLVVSRWRQVWQYQPSRACRPPRRRLLSPALRISNEISPCRTRAVAVCRGISRLIQRPEKAQT